MKHEAEPPPLLARIPADINLPDKIAYGLTFRQILIITLTGGVAAAIYYLCHQLLPVVILAAILLPLLALGLAVALGRRDGLSLDRFALSALLFARARKRLVAAPEGVAGPPRWCRLRGKLPAPLRLPVQAIRTDGALELADGGVAVLVETSTLSFHLRTTSEQAALVGAFGRWLNSLEAPVQLLARARPADLSDLIHAIEHQADVLPHAALASAARDHAGYLAELNSSRELLTRQVLVVLRDHPPARRGRRSVRRDASAVVVLRRAAEAERALAALGVTTRVLDAEQAAQALTECLDPGGRHPLGQALPDEPIYATAQPSATARNLGRNT
ncbi:PrgI family protein [Nonomuraea pusilla]|uniref:PrgI family protein n=1 Tax=Nonomuraea pusilla TaxID=46177 RepID=A0A1H8JE38_9ACTN|nr:PrgI family protein [Nonomuraea pusilla]SEN79010.1 PrgI family protein [Nonomuraea pusilla]